MLPKKQRVPKDLFPSHTSPKQSVSGLFVSISFVKNTSPARASVVVSKKVSNSAVTRNTVRRRVYQALAELFSPKSQGILVVYAKKPIISAKYSELKSEIEALLLKTHFVFDKRMTP